MKKCGFDQNFLKIFLIFFSNFIDIIKNFYDFHSKFLKILPNFIEVFVFKRIFFKIYVR